jgi:ABC-type multidrug transport system fused ATPase/permease subunit
MATTGSYPARVEIDPPEETVRWRPLVQWFLAIPHLFVLNALQSVTQALAIISWFAILFTGRLPTGVASFQGMYVRYWLRTMSYVAFLREEYPGFTYTTATAEPGDDPRVRVDVAPEIDDRDRLTTAFRLILAIPHIVVLAVLAVVVLVVALVAVVVVLFTGRWPTGLRDFVIGVGRWWLRLEAYLLLLTDQYPPFSTSDLPLTRS